MPVLSGPSWPRRSSCSQSNNCKRPMHRHRRCPMETCLPVISRAVMSCERSCQSALKDRKAMRLRFRLLASAIPTLLLGISLPLVAAEGCGPGQQRVAGVCIDCPKDPRCPGNPRGIADPRGPVDPRGIADPRAPLDPRGPADPRGPLDPRGPGDHRGPGR
jgi:hypothetical protein